MNKKSKFISYIFLALGVLLVLQTSYLYANNSMTNDMSNSKKAFVTLVGLPDLAISTEATYVRHRSMSTMSNIFKDDGTLREYFASTYAFSHSNIINKKSIDE